METSPITDTSIVDVDEIQICSYPSRVIGFCKGRELSNIDTRDVEIYCTALQLKDCGMPLPLQSDADIHCTHGSGYFCAAIASEQ